MCILNRLPLASAATALVLAIASPALADKAAGDACAAQLNADGQTIYAATVNTSGDLRQVMTDTTRSLAISGKISRGDARTNAEAAAKCVQAARS